MLTRTQIKLHWLRYPFLPSNSLSDTDIHMTWNWASYVFPLLIEKNSGPSSFVGRWESVGPCRSPLYGNSLSTVCSLVSCIFPFQPVNDAILFGTGHNFFPGTAMYWQFGVKKSSESWFSCKKASRRRASCSTCTECHLLYNLADLYSAGICCCWLCIQVFLRGGYSIVVLASLIMSKLASTKKARSDCSRCLYLCIIIRITKSHISLAHLYSDLKIKDEKKEWKP